MTREQDNREAFEASATTEALAKSFHDGWQAATAHHAAAVRRLVEMWREESKTKYPHGAARNRLSEYQLSTVEARCDQLDACADELEAALADPAIRAIVEGEK